MWIYEKRLEFPVNIKEPNAQMAQFIMSQYGGPDGEMGASMRYLSQRYAMPYKECKGTLTDIGTEELAHLEIVAAIIHQLTKSKGDVITDLHEDMAAEQKARSTYDNILRVVKDYDVCEPIKFLREREVVHYQRFGELLRITQEKLDSRNFYAFNPAFDMQSPSCQDQMRQM